MFSNVCLLMNSIVLSLSNVRLTSLSCAQDKKRCFELLENGKTKQ